MSDVRNRRLTWGLHALTALPFAVWAVLLHEYGVDVYRLDQWYTPSMAMQAVFAGDASVEVFFQQHNEARKVVPTLLSVGLALANGYWDVRLELAIGFVFCVLLVVAMGLVVRATPGFRSWQSACITCFFSLLLWSPLTLYFHTFSITFERLIPELCLVIGVFVFLTVTDLWRLVLAFSVLAVISQFSFPGGLIAWPLFLLLLLHVVRSELRSRWPGVVCYILVGAVAVSLYFWDYSSPSGHPGLTRVFDHGWTDISSFFFMVLGRPFAEHYFPGVAVGLLVVALFLTGIVLAGRLYWNTRAYMGWVVLGLYSLSQAALITAGRLPLSMESATGRDYVIHGVYIVIAALMLLALGTHASARRSATITLVVCSLFLGILLGAVTESPLGRLREQYYSLQQDKTCIRLFPLLETQRCLGPVYPWPEQILPRILAADRLGIMKPPLVHRIASATDVPIQGLVEWSFWAPEGLHFDGWAVVGGETVDGVAITANMGEGDEGIIGIFRGGILRNDLWGTIGVEARYAGWAGNIPESELVYDVDAQNCGLKAYAYKNGNLYELPWNPTAVATWCGRDHGLGTDMDDGMGRPLAQSDPFYSSMVWRLFHPDGHNGLH